MLILSKGVTAVQKTESEPHSHGMSDSSSRSSSVVLSAEESKRVQKLRILLYFLLFIVGISVSASVYIIVAAGENEKFESTFIGLAEQLAYVSYEIAHDKVGSVSWFQVALTSYALDRDLKWPFVTISAFQQRADAAISTSRACQLSFHPIVYDMNRSLWEKKYAIDQGLSFMNESLEYESQESNSYFFGNDYFHGRLIDERNLTTFQITESAPEFYELEPEGGLESAEPGPYLPFWQSAPYIPRDINVNVKNSPDFREMERVMETRKATIGRFLTKPAGNASSSMFAALLSHRDQEQVYYYGDPLSHFYLPVFETLQKKDDNQNNRTIVGIVVLLFEWASYFQNILHGQGHGIIMVLENPCDGAHTYEINGAEVEYLGPGDLHDVNYTNLSRRESFDGIASLRDGSAIGVLFDSEYCTMSFSLYPSKKFYDSHRTNMPIIMTMTVFVVFMFAILMFMSYNRLVDRRQQLVLNRALQSTAVVKSLFPKSVAEQLIQQCDATVTSSSKFSSNKTRLKSFLVNDNVENSPVTDGSPSLAEFFPFCSVLFTDISGFAAWSSTREASQVFDLLQALYQAFDVVAKQRHVFKVETVSDSYVAVTGVPDQQQHHAVIMARFAWEMNQVGARITHELGLKLGPGTSELRMRIGIHSGPVTAGVLRGEKARFQLFGDTVNMAAQMKSTGIASKVHISSSTAALLIDAGKVHWVTPRDEVVDVKGKGSCKTYWLRIKSSGTGSVRSKNSGSRNVTGGASINCNPQTQEHDRHVRWICDLLLTHIRKLVAYRKTSMAHSGLKLRNDILNFKSNPLCEVVEAINIPEYQHINDAEVESVVVNDNVVRQLHQYISTISSSYRDNPFHCFEHACHVTMSVNKLLTRIVKPDIDIDINDGRDVASHFYDYSYGINSDPIILLGIIFSAVIHDADHRGVSNSQMMKEETNMAKHYEYKSIAEQNSLDIAWNILMSNDYRDLRECLFQNEDELKRFRQVLVNLVLATDIFDKDLNDLRKQRWEKAFSKDSLSDSSKEARNIRAMIVMEHVIQASDVSHTMQHWNIYRKWNGRLFKEMYFAYKTGRMGADPTEFWYTGELSFFDNYIIPLAKKLKECKVFGVSSDEYLTYAERNRTEWADRGQEILSEMIAEAKQIDDNNDLFPKLDIDTINDDDSECSSDC